MFLKSASERAAMAGLSDEAREARNAYRREWYAKNKDKAREQQERYWTRKAAELAEEKKKSDR